MTFRSQKGVALISVLFIVVIITIIISQVFRQSRSDLKRTQWLVESAQAYQYALGGEQLARQILHEQFEVRKKEGLLQSPIPGPAKGYQPEHGTIRLQIIDLQGRLDLNGVTSNHLQVLVNRALEGSGQPPQFAQALADWVDGDTLPRPGGAEDFQYMAGEDGYRTANRTMADPSELFSLAGADPTLLQPLMPMLAALDTPTAININTAPAALLALIYPGISPAQVEGVRSASATGFTSVDAFIQSDVVAGLGLDSSALTTQSTYFAAQVVADAGDSQMTMESRFRLDPASGILTLLDRTFLLPQASQQQLIQDTQDRANAVDSPL